MTFARRPAGFFLTEFEAALKGEPAGMPASGSGLPGRLDGWSRLFGGNSTPRASSSPPESRHSREDELAARWQAAATAASDPAEAAAYRSLLHTLAGIVGKRGQLVGDAELLSGLALRDFSNGYGSKFVGERLTTLIHTAGAPGRFQDPAGPGQAGHHERQGRICCRQEARCVHCKSI